MHTYASQTPEARELVSELEFVWDQIKYNASSSSGSGPLNAVGVPPLSRHQGSSYGSINGRLLSQSPEHYDRPNIRANDGHDSRLRVLSPVSQPEEDEYYRRRRRRLTDDMDEQAIDDDDEDDEDEEYEEARDSLYEHQDNASTTADTTADTNTGTEATASHGDDPSQHRHHRHRDSMAASGTVDLESNSPGHRRDSHDPSNPKNSRWRRRVEQALTKMTAEIAAVREQMETRTLANRRRSGLWAWLKWILWTVTRQIIWDLALLAALLIWMRIRGDRRVEDRLRTGWLELKTRLGRFKLLSRFSKAPLLP